MNKVQWFAAAGVGFILLLAAAAALLLPYVPYLFALFFLAMLFRIILRG